jgi:hypothetical protein
MRQALEQTVRAYEDAHPACPPVWRDGESPPGDGAPPGADARWPGGAGPTAPVGSGVSAALPPGAGLSGDVGAGQVTPELAAARALDA